MSARVFVCEYVYIYSLYTYVRPGTMYVTYTRSFRRRVIKKKVLITAKLGILRVEVMMEDARDIKLWE